MKIDTLYRIVIAGIFLVQSISKLSGTNDMLYAKWGLEGNVLLALGVVELILALLMFTKYAHITSILMVFILMGAFATLIRFNEPITRFIMPTIALATISMFSGKYWMDLVKSRLF